MKLTGIDETNYDYFRPLYLGESKEYNPSNTIMAGVIDGGLPCALAVMEFDHKERTAEIVSVYTIEQSRRKGAASMALGALIKTAEALEADTITAFGTSEMKGLYEFLENEGFDMFSDAEEEIYPLSELLKKEKIKKYLARDFKKNFLTLSKLENKTELKRKLADFPGVYTDDELDDELSMVVLDEGGSVNAALFAEKRDNADTVTVDFAVSFSDNSLDIVALLVHFIKTISEHSDVKNIAFLPVNQSIDRFMREMTISTGGQKVYHGVMKLL